MNVFALCGIALIAFAAIEIVGKEQQRLGIAVGAVGAVCLLTPAVLSLAGVFAEINGRIEAFPFFGRDLLFRAFGIGLCCEITGDVLRDAGRQNLASALDFSSKAAILALCLPLWKELFSLAEELVS